MNSLLAGLGSFLANGGAGMGIGKSNINAIPQIANSPNILLQAVGAALRGEDPHTFMQKLAQTHPQLQQYDFSNLQQTAQQICQQNNVDIQGAINQIDSMVDSLNK